MMCNITLCGAIFVEATRYVECGLSKEHETSGDYISLTKNLQTQQIFLKFKLLSNKLQEKNLSCPHG